MVERRCVDKPDAEPQRNSEISLPRDLAGNGFARARSARATNELRENEKVARALRARAGRKAPPEASLPPDMNLKRAVELRGDSHLLAALRRIHFTEPLTRWQISAFR